MNVSTSRFWAGVLHRLYVLKKSSLIIHEERNIGTSNTSLNSIPSKKHEIPNSKNPQEPEETANPQTQHTARNPRGNSIRGAQAKRFTRSNSRLLPSKAVCVAPLRFRLHGLGCIV